MSKYVRYSIIDDIIVFFKLLKFVAIDFFSIFQRYIQCFHQKLYHLTSADYEDFANIILAARAAFQITPEGNAQFKDWLQTIRRYVNVF